MVQALQQPTSRGDIWSCFQTDRFRSWSPHRCGHQVRILGGGKVMRPLSVSRTKLPKLGAARSGRGRARPSHRLRSRGNRAAAGRWTSGQAHQMRRRMGPRRRAPRGHDMGVGRRDAAVQFGQTSSTSAQFAKLRRRHRSLSQTSSTSSQFEPNFVDVIGVWRH